MAFKKGDRVRYDIIDNCACFDLEKATGTVAEDSDDQLVRVLWDGSQSIRDHSPLYVKPIVLPSYGPPLQGNRADILIVDDIEPGILPTDRAARKAIPLYSGVLMYFPAALVEVAKRSHEGNEQHNPGQDLHWARAKSDDHLDAATRHIMEGELDGAAWRILAALQMKLEAEGAPVAPAAR